MIEQLRQAEPGQKIKTPLGMARAREIKHASTNTACRGCVFDFGQGADGCPYSTACMAHLRPDNKPVKFMKA